MKLNNIFLSVCVAGAALSMASCVDDLDLTPTDPRSIVSEQFKTNPEQYMKQLIADCYLQYATYGVNGDASVQKFDSGMSTFQRAVFLLEEAITDEASWIPNDADYGTFQYGIIPANNTVVMGTYSRLFINIACCNQFIQTVNAGYFAIEGNEKLEKLAKDLIRQARILRAGAYYYAIDCFGNVPYMDENTPMGVTGAQLGRAEITRKVVSDLEDIVAEYKAEDPDQKPPYGYVGLDVAEALLVKFYLNYGVYTGTPDWTSCISHAEAIIERLKGAGFQGTGLTEAYHQNFAYNNKNFAIGGASPVNEIIWTIPQANPQLLSYANGTFMVNGWVGTSTPDAKWQCDPKALYNTGNAGWKCIVARREFVEKFDWDASYSVSPDIRTKLWMTAANGFGIDNISLSQADYGNNGFLAVKFTNWAIDDNGNIDKANSPAPTDQLGLDYPMIRLAEIYLSAAEAYLNTGNEEMALKYTNYIRERAGMPPFTQLTPALLRDERCRELYTESTRRTDLIRYNQWISGYTWAWKNYRQQGGDFASNFDLFPIPSSVVTRNGYTQNPGY